MSYYTYYNRRTVEMFANLFGMYCGQEHWKRHEENSPEITDEFKAILRGLS